MINLKLILIFCILISSNAWSQNFKITPTSQDVDTKQISKEQLPRNSHRRVPYLTPQKRDEVLNKYFTEEIKDWDELERDLLYKSLINYEKARLVKKYPFLNKVNISKVKNELQ